jgi:hypothetical protein
MTRGLKLALLGVTALAAGSSFLFLTQGGFGGGHGDFDTVLFIMGLPWAAFRWPSVFIQHDFVWLVALPFCMNVITLLGLAAILRTKHRSDAPTRP